MRRLALQLVKDARAAGVPLIITSSLRSPAVEASYVAAGRSSTMNSLHLKGRAFDVDVSGYARDRISRRFWAVIGPHGESLGLRWGGRWRSPYDPGHFEL